MTIMPLFRTLHLRIKRTAIIANQSGVAAMEFAIIAPMIIAMYLGLAELAALLSVERKISHSASVAGDLTTQVATLDASEAEDLVAAVVRVANISELQDYGVRIQSFERRRDGTIESAGVITYNSGAQEYSQGDLSEDLLPRGSGIVVATVSYDYRPFGFSKVSGPQRDRRFLPDSINLNETFLLKPRRSSVVQIGDADADTQFSCSGTSSGINCSG